MAELADAADLKSAGEILVGSSPSPGTRLGVNMPWLIIVVAYFLGSIPTAYIAGRLLQGRDIREMGDGNAGAANAFRELGPRTGILVGIIDAAKGALAILIGEAADIPQPTLLAVGVAAVVGHNWPFFLHFRGGRGESTTIGILLVLITQPMLIMAVPALATLVISRNVVLASAVLFILLPIVCWWLKVPGVLVSYAVGLACLGGITHFFRTRGTIPRPT